MLNSSNKFQLKKSKKSNKMNDFTNYSQINLEETVNLNESNQSQRQTEIVKKEKCESVQDEAKKSLNKIIIQETKCSTSQNQGKNKKENFNQKTEKSICLDESILNKSKYNFDYKKIYFPGKLLVLANEMFNRQKLFVKVSKMLNL